MSTMDPLILSIKMETIDLMRTTWMEMMTMQTV
jgi:hypothetical protein